MLTLKALGALDAHDTDGRPLTVLLAQPKRAGLLAYLALAHPEELYRRDSLLALFWPELDQAHGRAALSQALTFLRRHLPDDTLLARGSEEVGVDATRVRTDVAEFESAVTEGDWDRAVDLYEGDLLEGLHVWEAAPFIDWVDRQRVRLREAAAGAAWKRAHQFLEIGALADAEGMARRALHLVPTNESSVRTFIGALADAGDRAAALRFYDRFAELLAQELEVEPAPETVAVVEATRSRTGPASEPEGEGRASPSPATPRHAERTDPMAPGGGETRPVRPLRRIDPLRPSRSRWSVAAAAVMSVSTVAVLVALGVRTSHSGETAARGSSAPRVAVLPFVPLGQDSARTSLAAGVTSQLATSLSGVQGLRVIPAPPSLGSRPLPEIGPELNADLLVQGTVLVAESKVRITTRLFAPASDRTVWTDTYDGDLSDVLPFLSTVTRSIAGQVKVMVTREAARRLASAPTTSPPVMKAMLRARILVERETPESLDQAIRLLNEALNLDPTFAPAWGLLAHAEVLSNSWFTNQGSGAKAMARVEQATRRALALDPGEPDGLIGRAALYENRGEWAAAVRTYRTILAEHPSYSVAGVYLANTLTWMGRYEEAEAAARAMVELDPLWGTAHFELVNVLWESRQYDRALAGLADALSLDPDNPNYRALTAGALAWLGRCDEPGSLFPAELGMGTPAEEMERLLRLTDEPGSWLLGTGMVVFARCGRKDRALELYGAMEQMAATGYVSSIERALAHVAVGRMDDVLDLLEEGVEDQEAEVLPLTNGERFNTLRDSLRGNPRFEAIVDGIGMPRSPLKWSPRPVDPEPAG